MPRNRDNTAVADEVETDQANTIDEVDLGEPDETETVTDQQAAGQGKADPNKAAAAKKNPRWTPPEGYVTLVKFAKVISERKLHTPRGASEPSDINSQMVYSYAGNAPKEDKFPRVFFDEGGNIV